jgi:acyl-CoA thioester hydrolase
MDELARRDPESYPARIHVRALFSDMDVFRHINNTALSRYFEEGRADLNIIAFGAASITAPTNDEQILFASATIDFLAPARYPGGLEIGTGVLRIGRSSYTVAQAAFQEGTCIALCEVVAVRAARGRSRPLTAVESNALQALQMRAAHDPAPVPANYPLN